MKWFLLAFLLAAPVFSQAAVPYADKIAAYRRALPHEYNVPYTGSMRPLVYGGERCRITAVSYADLKATDWVCYLPADGLKAHALVARRPHPGTLGVWIVKGIHNREPDRFYCTPENYIGVITKL